MTPTLRVVLIVVSILTTFMIMRKIRQSKLQKMFHMSIKQSQLETKIKDLAQKIALDENERGKEAQTSVKKVVSQKNE